MADRAEGHEPLSEALRAFAVEVEQYIHAAGGVEAIHRTDLSALSLTMDADAEGNQLTPGELASRMSLSPSATTSMLDRLEAAGHVVRSRTSSDRRLVTVTATDKARETGYRIFSPLASAFATVMDGYTPDQLALVERFLNEITDATRSARSGAQPEQPGR